MRRIVAIEGREMDENRDLTLQRIEKKIGVCNGEKNQYRSTRSLSLSVFLFEII